MQSISAALESVDEKKENLRKAFEDIEVRSASSLNGFTLRWKDIEDHFDSIKRSLQLRFDKLEPSNQPDSDRYRRMKSFCVKMDGLGLRSYILQSQAKFHGLKSFNDEVGAALASASDAGELVLDAMESFYPVTPTSDLDNIGRGEQELNCLRSVCNMLLEQLNTISPHVRPQTKMKAKQLAMEWKTKAKLANNRPLSQFPKEVIAFLQLIATYRLVSLFQDDPDLFDFVVSIAWCKQAANLIQSLDIKDKIPDLITKLTNNGKELDAFKFVYAFELVDKFPPVPLLRNHLNRSIKAAQEIRQKGKGSAKSLRMAADKELFTLRAVIKCIEERNLDSEYPRGTLVDRVEVLVKQQAYRKRAATVPPVKEQQQSTKKHARPTATETLSTNTLFPQSHVQCMSSSVGHLPHASPYMSSPAQYGFPGINPGVHNYMTNAAELYGLVANPVSSTYGLGANPVNFYGVGANPVNFFGLGPSGSHVHSNPNMPGGFYNPFHPY